MVVPPEIVALLEKPAVVRIYDLRTGAFEQRLKRCWTCKQDREVGEFTVDSSRKDGLSGRCRTCTADAGRQVKERRRSLEAGEGYKICAMCSERLPVEAFAKRYSGLQSACRECKNKEGAAYRARRLTNARPPA